MRTLKFELELDKLGLKAEEGNEVNHKVTFEQYVQMGLSSVYPRGLDNKTRREYLGILKKLDESTDGTLKLEEAEFELLTASLNKGVFEAKHTRLIGFYLQAIEGAQKL